jgi:uncharacterized membrane protein
MDEFFGTFGGLPLHPLVVHFAIVLIPLGAIGLIVVSVVPRFRKTYLPLVMGTLGIGAMFAFVAKESGEYLSSSQGKPQEHAALGDVLFPASVGLVALAVTLWLVTRSERPVVHVRAALVASIIGALSVTALTVVVGHSGATATWGSRINSAAPVETPTATPAPTLSPTAEGTAGADDNSTSSSGGSTATGSTTNGGSTSGGTSDNGDGSTDTGSGGITMADVRTHNTAADCWAVVGISVIDLTGFISRHPGGASALTALCGTDATAAFQSQHGSARMPASQVQRLTIGSLSG